MSASLPAKGNVFRLVKSDGGFVSTEYMNAHEVQALWVKQERLHGLDGAHDGSNEDRCWDQVLLIFIYQFEDGVIVVFRSDAEVIPERRSTVSLPASAVCGDAFASGCTRELRAELLKRV